MYNCAGWRDPTTFTLCLSSWMATTLGPDLEPPLWPPYPYALFPQLPPQTAPLPGIYPHTVPGNKEELMTTGDTLGQAVPLSQVHHMAMGPRLSDTNKRRHPLAQRGTRDLWPADLNALGPSRALLHLTMKPTAQLLSALAGEKHFIVEGHTDNIMSPAANTLADAVDAWDEAIGHPAERNA